MKTNQKNHKQALGVSIAIVVGVGLALGSSMGNYLTGTILAFPIGIALYYYKLKKTD